MTTANGGGSAAVADEVCSLVIDLGARHVRAGYSGDERPAAVVPSFAAVRPGAAPGFGDLALGQWRAGQDPSLGFEVVSVVGAEGPLDWELAAQLLDHVVAKVLGARWDEHPVLLVDSPAWPKGVRERLVEMLFARFAVPAVFLGRAPVLAAFAAGRHTGLVVDLGASAARVCPVVDGMALRAACVSERSLGGDALNDAVARLLLPGDLDVFPCCVASRTPVPLGDAPVCALVPGFDASTGVTSSFVGHQRRLLLEEIKESALAASEAPATDAELAVRPPKYYELPSGAARQFGVPRFAACEALFSSEAGLPALVARALQMCDGEARALAYGGAVLLTGGGACIPGVAERVAHELARLPAYAGGRVRVQPTGATPAERRAGAWLGGSILASLGSFAQMWLTRAEFLQHGASYIDRKCP